MKIIGGGQFIDGLSAGFDQFIEKPIQGIDEFLKLPSVTDGGTCELLPQTAEFVIGTVQGRKGCRFQKYFFAAKK